MTWPRTWYLTHIPVKPHCYFNTYISTKKNVVRNNKIGYDNVFWVIILIMRYESVSQRDLCSSRSQWPGIGKTDLMRPGFDHLWSCIQFPIQNQPRKEWMNMKDWEWKLVNDQIENFNRNILEKLSPSDTLCVDEIFRREYSLGGDWC